jgi:uncharacterized protein (DUF2235 family)
MGKNIIICSDGTGNTFDDDITNVTRLIKCIELNSDQQIAVYDQGVGTTAAREEAVRAYEQSLGNPASFQILPAPEAAPEPKAWLDRGRGLAFGSGLKANVREMYGVLSELYDGPDDSVFLFGFSRGAFTVRALAGLLYLCQLPRQGCGDFETRFECAWRLYNVRHEDQDQAAISELRETQRPCSVHFLGLWDTVKSYGGLNPVMLPHLRHNPLVKHVRHALALDEQRAWFNATTWGQLDHDKEPGKAMSRVRAEDLPMYRTQDIAEVWFRGCHSDIGGGKREMVTAEIALRWMLGEAVNVEPGLRLNDDGKNLLKKPDPAGPPRIHRRWKYVWRVVELVPRKELDNSGKYPVKRMSWRNDGRRVLDGLRRDNKIHLHATALNAHSIPKKIELEIRQTRSIPR